MMTFLFLFAMLSFLLFFFVVVVDHRLMDIHTRHGAARMPPRL
jgi:hypothetical protein